MRLVGRVNPDGTDAHQLNRPQGIVPNNRVLVRLRDYTPRSWTANSPLLLTGNMATIEVDETIVDAFDALERPIMDTSQLIVVDRLRNTSPIKIESKAGGVYHLKIQWQDSN